MHLDCSVLVIFKGCKRCGGDMTQAPETDTVEMRCIACGNRAYKGRVVVEQPPPRGFRGSYRQRKG